MCKQQACPQEHDYCMLLPVQSNWANCWGEGGPLSVPPGKSVIPTILPTDPVSFLMQKSRYQEGVQDDASCLHYLPCAANVGIKTFCTGSCMKRREAGMQTPCHWTDTIVLTKQFNIVGKDG